MACTASIQANTGLRNPSKKKIQSLAQAKFIRKLDIKLSSMHGGHLIPLIFQRFFQIDINFPATFHTKHISHMSKITGNSTTKLRSTTIFLYIAWHTSLYRETLIKYLFSKCYVIENLN